MEKQVPIEKKISQVQYLSWIIQRTILPWLTGIDTNFQKYGVHAYRSIDVSYMYLQRPCVVKYLIWNLNHNDKELRIVLIMNIALIKPKNESQINQQNLCLEIRLTNLLKITFVLLFS